MSAISGLGADVGGEAEEAPMLTCEIIRTCAHEKVAEAAVLSIGTAFRDRVALLAAASGMSAGAYVAELVRRFSEEANERDLEALTAATVGSDMPILKGLRWIVEFMIDGATHRDGDPRRIRSGGADRARGAVRCAQAA
jgi:hypothetical protein